MQIHTRQRIYLALLLAATLTLLLWASTARSTTLQTTTFINVGQGASCARIQHAGGGLAQVERDGR